MPGAGGVGRARRDGSAYRSGAGDQRRVQFAISQFDRATQAYRQTGSAIKPFVFLTALDHGFTPSTLVSDAPISLPQGPGLPMWTPINYEADRFRGPTPLRIGLEQSIDTLTVRLATMIGMDAIADTIERFGILDHVPHEYAITLGAGATTPLRLTPPMRCSSMAASALRRP